MEHSSVRCQRCPDAAAAAWTATFAAIATEAITSVAASPAAAVAVATAEPTAAESSFAWKRATTCTESTTPQSPPCTSTFTAGSAA